jgi:effector-binding domain-containing protein
MKTIFFKVILFVCISAISFSCSNSDPSLLSEKQINDSLQKTKTKTIDISALSKEPGVIGIFNVGELLTICKIDSAPMKDVSFRVAKNYSVLEEEMNAVDAKLNGSPGMITYNNDTSNFIFECVLPIKELPKKQPKTCKIVYLEATQMLIFNFYGPYQHLFSAYDKIRKYNTANHLQQSGPMREFYLSDPTVEIDPAKWQTQIMVPVIKTNQ